ncbi:hypothetical protein D6C88_05803, partial [Aureobasidium pullulans]
ILSQYENKSINKHRLVRPKTYVHPTILYKELDISLTLVASALRQKTKLWSRYSEKSKEQKKEAIVVVTFKAIPHLNNKQRVLVHSDLLANNIIIDQHSNLKSVYDFANLDSILDLGWAEIVPLQFATACKKTDLSFGNVFERGLSIRVDSVKFITIFYAETTRLNATSGS